MRWPSLVACLAPLLSLAACGPEPAAPGENSDSDGPADGSEYAEVCGTLGPHRLLELAPGERLHSVFGDTRIDDRLYFVTVTGLQQYPDPPGTAYSTGLCGEDRRHLADDIQRVLSHEKLPGVLLGCRDTIDGPLFVLDPAGTAAPRLLAAAGCRHDEWATHGFVQVDDQAGDLGPVLFYPYPADFGAGPLSPVVLVEAVRTRSHVLHADEVLAIDPDDNLIRVALPDGQVTVEQAGVRDFMASEDGRYLAWEDLATADPDPEGSQGDLVLRDRQTGVETVLAAAPHPFRMARLSSVRIEVWHREDFGGGKLVDLPSLVAAEVPPHRRLWFPFTDRRWLMEGEDEAWYLFDPVADTEVLITAEPGFVDRASVDYMYFLPRPDGEESTDTHELWRYRFDGSEPELLAHRVDEWAQLPDERIFTLVDIDPEGLGDLVVIDPETLEEHRLDSRARPLSRYSWYTSIAEDDTIAYQVFDGDRSGVWIVRPASQ